LSPQEPCVANHFNNSLADNPQIQCNPDRITRVARLVFIAAATLLSAGAGLAQYPSGRYLTVAGYALFAVILVAMIFIQLFLWRDSATLIPYTRKVHLSMPLWCKMCSNQVEFLRPSRTQHLRSRSSSCELSTRLQTPPLPPTPVRRGAPCTATWSYLRSCVFSWNTLRFAYTCGLD
jgi:hypothetical protein